MSVVSIPSRGFAAPTAAKTAAPAGTPALTFLKPAPAGHRVILYGTGGAGKTTLACSLPGRTAFIDLDESLGKLPAIRAKIDAGEVCAVDVRDPSTGEPTWERLCAALRAPGWDGVRNIVIDSFTAAEELAKAHVLKTVPVGKGVMARSIEDYGYGKGYVHLFDAVTGLLPDLERHVRAGRNIVLICHECVVTSPNPAGDDFMRYEPRLQSPSGGKASIRYRFKEWADHVLFLRLDCEVTEDGKAKGGYFRTVYPADLQWCMAKSRTLTAEAVVEDGAAFWQTLLA